MIERPLPRFVTLAILLAGICAAGACRGESSPPTTIIGGVQQTPEERAEAEKVTIAFLGDSLTAGLGLLADQAYPALIQRMFVAEGYTYVDVINGGASGDTSAGGLRRVEQLLQPTVRILVIALGANDALRGLTVRQTHDNLAALIEGASSLGLGVVLAGMEAPTNLGEDYRTAFRDMFTQLSIEYGRVIAFVPFLLEGVAGNPALNQPDGIHPNVEGARVIAELLYPTLKILVEQIPQTGN